jgi:hypothetical protein
LRLVAEVALGNRAKGVAAHDDMDDRRHRRDAAPWGERLNVRAGRRRRRVHAGFVIWRERADEDQDGADDDDDAH